MCLWCMWWFNKEIAIFIVYSRFIVAGGIRKACRQPRDINIIFQTLYPPNLDVDVLVRWPSLSTSSVCSHVIRMMIVTFLMITDKVESFIIMMHYAPQQTESVWLVTYKARMEQNCKYTKNVGYRWSYSKRQMEEQTPRHTINPSAASPVWPAPA